MRPSWGAILKRLLWDIQDSSERRYYGYWLIGNLPGLFGDMVRARYVSKRMKRAGSGLTVMAGCRFRSMECLEVGENVSIGFDNFLQARGGLVIGDNVATAPGVKIWSVNHRYDDPDQPVLDQGHDVKPVKIGNNVFIAANAFLLPGVVLGDGCVVSAGSIVSGKEYPPFSIIAGNPARIIGYRGKKAAPNEQSQIGPG